MIWLLACTTGTEVDTIPEAQDVGLTDATSIRTTLDEGLVPTRERWLEAALFWSHDLDLGEECETDLCAQVRTALVSPLGADSAQVLVVVDFAPSPHAGTVNVVYAVDASGSMGPDASDLVRESLGASLEGIDAQDLGALVLFAETAKVAEKTRAMERTSRSKPRSTRTA